MTGDGPREQVRGTVVAWADRGLLIVGASGSGKSALALDLMAFGCALVSDDGTLLERRGDRVWASCPPAIAGLIEARGIGLLNAVPSGPVALIAVLDLDREETERLPPDRTVTLLGLPLPALHKPSTGLSAAAILQYLKAGRRHA